MEGQNGITPRIPLRDKKRRRTVLSVLTAAAFLLILCSTDAAIEYMKKGLVLCSAAVIPALFPFMVISELIVASGLGVRLSSFLARPMRRIFGVSEAGAAVYLLGALCGFPIGAKTAASMYDKGIIGKDELERLMIFSNNPGSAFVISAVGTALLGNKKLGILLYACVIVSSLVTGFSSKLFSKKNTYRSRPLVISNELSVKAVTDAVQSSALSMLSVCAYVVFFSAFVGCIGALLAPFSLPEEILACIFGFFELSSGVNAAASTGHRLASVVLCAFFLGWSGLSVHFQIMSVSSGRNISFKPYFIAKAVQGVLCATLAWLSVSFIFPFLLDANSDAFAPNANTYSYIGRYTCTALFISALIFALFSSKKKN